MSPSREYSDGGQRWSNLVEVITAAAMHMEGCIVALQQRNAPDFRRHLDAARQERARLSRLHRLMPAGAPATPSEAQAMATVRMQLERIKLADQAIDLLMPMYLQETESGLEASENASDLLVDRSLGRVFDLQHDLTILVGVDSARHLPTFLHRGYKQTVVITAPGEEPPTSSTEGGLIFSRIEDLETYCANISVHAHERTAYIDNSPGIPSEFIDQVKAIVSTAINTANSGRGTRRRQGSTWARLCIANLAHLAKAPAVNNFSGVLAGKPAIVVCPGPSLEKSLEALREAQGSAVIIAVNHALRNLAGSGITPDFVIALDPSERLIEHFSDISLENVQALILANSVRTELFRVPSVPRILRMSCNVAAEKWLDEFLIQQQPVVGGGTIAHAGAVLAQMWGCNPIVFVGQDLAYSGGKVYADGTAENRQLIATDDPRFAREGNVTRFMLEVEGWNDERLSTSLQFHMYRKWYEDWVASLPGTRFINCSEGGARIKGMEHLPLAEAAKSFSKKFSVAALLESAWDRTSVPELERHVLDLSERRQRALEQACRLAKRCRRLSEESRTQPHKETSLKQSEEELRQSLATLPEVSLSLQREIQDIQLKVPDLRELNQAISASTLLYERIESNCRDLLVTYKEAIRDMRRPTPVG